MTCDRCAANAPAYTLTNLCCCIRLVRNSRPLRSRQETMLHIISKTPGAPSRKQILGGLQLAALTVGGK